MGKEFTLLIEEEKNPQPQISEVQTYDRPRRPPDVASVTRKLSFGTRGAIFVPVSIFLETQQK